MNQVAESESATVALERLRGIVSGYGSALVAYSGGVDSTVVLAIARQELGENALGIIGNSPAYPASERADAIKIAETAGLPIRVIATDEHLDPHYLANRADRCFHCRSHLFQLLSRLAAQEGYAAVLDGVHADDLRDHAGGIAAGRRHGVRSPLLEAGLGKLAVRAIARALNLPVWNKPALACLASRISTGTPVNILLLSQIERAEDVLRAMGFVDFRVRHHGELARLEVSVADLQRAIELMPRILEAIKGVGYRHVTLDLQLRK